MDTGVYQIKNLLNGRLYVGSAATSIRKRWVNHINDLRKNKHSNKRLQNSFNVNGEKCFEFIILAYLPPEKCLSVEQWYLDVLKPFYNICKTAGSRYGTTHTKETIQKMREKSINRVLSQETKDKISKFFLGRETGRKGIRASEETKRKLSIAGKGRPSHRKGKSMSEATKERMRMAIRKPISNQGRLNLSKSLKGKKHTEERKINNRNGQIKFQYTILTPDNIVETTGSLWHYSEQRGLHGSSLSNTLRGFNYIGHKTDTHKGYKVIKKEPIKKIEQEQMQEQPMQ